MTCIAYRRGIVAADSIACRGDWRVASVRKIWRLPDGRVVAGSGHAAEVEGFYRWALMPGRNPRPKLADSTGIIIAHDRIHVHEGEHYITLSTGPGAFYAWGSGGVAAIAAMMARPDVSAREAVAIAGKLDGGSGGRIRTYKVRRG